MFPLRAMMWSVGITMICTMVVSAQQVVSLDEAVGLFRQNSLERMLAIHVTESKKGESASFSAFPNPELTIYREDLSRGEPHYDELTISVRQKIEILGQPFLKWSAESAESDAADLGFQHQELLLVQQFKTLFLDMMLLQQRHRTLEATTQAVQRAYHAAKARKGEGSLSGFDLQRLFVELAKYQRELSTTLTKVHSLRSEILTSIYPNTPWGEGDPASIVFTDSFRVQPPPNSLAEAESLALVHRKDLRSAEAFIVAAKHRLSDAQRDRFPALFLEGGYKQQGDGSKGYVFGGSLSIPIFSFNGGKIQLAEALYHESKVSLAIAHRNALAEARSAFRTSKAIWSRWNDLQSGPTTSALLEVALFSYDEGRLSLLEFLDAARAYNEGETLRAETLSDYHKSLFALETAIGGFLFTGKDIEE